MTETRKPAGTDYVPISCAFHSEYELAILRRQRLRLVWNDSSVIRDQVVQPFDLRTTNRGEFLICRTEGDTTQNIRLDRVQRMYPA